MKKDTQRQDNLRRIPLQENIKCRDATLTKDPIVFNGYIDKSPTGKVYTVKRPGIWTQITGSSNAGGIFFYNGALYTFDTTSGATYPASISYFGGGAGGGAGAGAGYGNYGSYPINTIGNYDSGTGDVTFTSNADLIVGDTIDISLPNGYTQTCVPITTVTTLHVYHYTSTSGDPGVMITGTGTVVRKPKCGTKPAYPASTPGYVATSIPAGATLTINSFYTSNGSVWTRCSPTGVVWTILARTTELKANGTVVYTGYYSGTLFYRDDGSGGPMGGGQVGQTDSFMGYVLSAGAGSYSIENGEDAVGYGCGWPTTPLTAIDTRVTTAYTIAQSNALATKVAAYNADVAKWNAACCP
jgi:hypothetical protein